MSVSNKKNKADDSEILETFSGFFLEIPEFLEEIGNAANKIVFTYSYLFFFLNCTYSDLEYAFSEHIQNKWIHRTETIKQWILNVIFLDV